MYIPDLKGHTHRILLFGYDSSFLRHSKKLPRLLRFLSSDVLFKPSEGVGSFGRGGNRKTGSNTTSCRQFYNINVTQTGFGSTLNLLRAILVCPHSVIDFHPTDLAVQPHSLLAKTFNLIAQTVKHKHGQCVRCLFSRQKGKNLDKIENCTLKGPYDLYLFHFV